MQITHPFTSFIFVMDRSLSMERLRQEAIDGFNTFVKKQKKRHRKKGGTVVLSLVQFNHTYEPLFYGVPIQHVGKLNEHTYIPAGNTALFDAIALTVHGGVDYHARPSVTIPDKTIVAIMTDGEENASTEYREAKDVKATIKRAKKLHNWKFIFLASGIDDPFRYAQEMGIRRGETVSMSDSAGGMSSGYAVMDYAVAGMMDDDFDPDGEGVEIDDEGKVEPAK